MTSSASDPAFITWPWTRGCGNYYVASQPSTTSGHSPFSPAAPGRLALAIGRVLYLLRSGCAYASTLALTAAAVAWRAARLTGARPSPPPAVVGALALVWCSYSLIEAWKGSHGFFAAAIPLLYLLAAARLLVRKSDREGLQVGLLCFAALPAEAIDSAGPGFVFM